MQFVQVGDWFKVARVTGPAHHFLGLRFGTSALNTNHQITGDVIAGVTRANMQFGTHYIVADIELADGDCYDANVYQELAYQLVAHLVASGHATRQAA
jgi:hypothetical protein